MKTQNKYQLSFLTELQMLLKKYNAEIELVTDFNSYEPESHIDINIGDINEDDGSVTAHFSYFSVDRIITKDTPLD